MQIIYRTIDGENFKDAYEAEKHEAAIRTQVQMWDWNNDRTDDTSCARLIHLIGEGAAAIFKAMVNENSEDIGIDVGATIDDDDTGWFYWDEFAEKYRYLDKEIIDAIVAATHQI